MKATISYKPWFELDLNKAIVDLLMDTAKKHYDHTCRVSCEQGGFIYGWKNCVEFETTCGASFRQLDLTLKIFEGFSGSIEEARLQLEYITLIKKLLDKSNQKTVLMPGELTAENGAKYLMSGEFSESTEFDCHECNGDDSEECEICESTGTITNKVPVSWTTIKNIYALAVKKLAVKEI